MKIYYAHFMGIYNTPQETRDMNTIKNLFPSADIFNPNSEESEQGYKIKGMDYFEEIIKTCDILVFRSLPHGKIPAGVFKEIECALNNNISVIELPCFTDRKMTVDDTRFYLKEIGFR